MLFDVFDLQLLEGGGDFGGVCLCKFVRDKFIRIACSLDCTDQFFDRERFLRAKQESFDDLG